MSLLALVPWFKNEIYPFYCHAAQGVKESTATNALAGILIIKLRQCNDSLKFGQLKHTQVGKT